MRAVAFCPGHVTGFFLVREHDDPLMTGSLGAGMCLTLGARSEVTVGEGDGLRVIVDGEEGGEVTRRAIELLLEGREVGARVETTLDLPSGQGFAMSAAGALSACFALGDLLDIPLQRCFEAAHLAEVEGGTGLGDVAALHRGGVTFRRREGLPPHGQVDRVPGSAPLLLCVVGESMDTASIITDEGMRGRMESVGRRCLRSLERRTTLSNLFKLSREFATETGMMGPEVREALSRLRSTGPASMAMLGNSIFCSGDIDRQEGILSPLGETFRVEMDFQGPRVLESTRRG